jgi:DNA-binding beta-propeller fold protein YncE
MCAGARVRVAVAMLVGSWAALALACPSAFGSKGVVSAFGSPGAGDGQFSNAYGTAVNLGNGEIYVVDQNQQRVQRFDADGGFLGAFGWGVADGNAAAETCSSACQPGLQGSGDGQFDTPQGIAIDQSDGSVYVVDGNSSRVEKFDASGAYVSQFGSAGTTEGQFSGPQGIAVDPSDGSVYVADGGNNRVEKFDSSGSFVRTFGFGVADGNSAFETCTTRRVGSTCSIPATGGSSATRAQTRSMRSLTPQTSSLPRRSRSARATITSTSLSGLRTSQSSVSSRSVTRVP